MFLKQSFILLFFGIFATSALAADIEEYDIETLKNMLRSMNKCSDGFTTYSDNVTQNYGTNIRKCDNTEKMARAKLDTASLESRKKFSTDSDISCKLIGQCENPNSHAADIFGCIADHSGRSGAIFSSMSFAAKGLENDVIKQEQSIITAKNSCTYKSTWVLSNKKGAGIDEVQNCFHTGDWDLFEPLIADAKPTKATVKPVTKKPATSERPAEKVTRVPARPAPKHEENARG